MPELPEVETIKNELEPHLTGRTFIDVIIHDEKPLQELSPNQFARRLKGKKIHGIFRRGKYILIELSHGDNLIMHLRMTGALLWNPCDNDPYARVEFLFDDGLRLIYSDVRRFGTIHLTRDSEKVVGKLGIDPLSHDFSAGFLGKMVSARKTPIKAVLLEQDLIAGIGNMYADEALFASRIYPAKPAQSLSAVEVKALHRGIQDVLKKAIRNKGASIRNYRCPDGTAGKAHEEFAVAHRGGKPCPHCNTPIARMVVRQRGTYYCPVCQPHKKGEKT